MVEQTTQHYNWTKPEITKSASTWGGFLNADLDAIDAQVFTNQGLFANYLPLTGGTLTGSLTVNGNIQGSYLTSTGDVYAAGGVTASGDVDAQGNVNVGNNVNVSGSVSAALDVTGNRTVYAGGGGFSTSAGLYAGGGVSAGAASIQTTGQISGNSITASVAYINGPSHFFNSTYNDFGTNINTGNNSRWLQFANGWSIQAIVNSSAYYFYIGGNTVTTLDYQGNLVIYNQGYKPGGGSWGASSDERVKRDIEPYRGGLKELNRLEPVSYAYNGKGGTRDDGKRYVGLIAQMAQRAMPSLVHELPGEFDGKLDGQLGLDSSELVFTLINAVKELAAELATLKARMP